MVQIAIEKHSKCEKLMANYISNEQVSTKVYWLGWIVSGLPILMLVFSAITKFLKPEFAIEGFTKLGWDAKLAFALGIVELSCTVIYLIPPTAVLGAILLTGYLGGAVATHVRIGDAFFMPIVLGILIWGGLWLRDLRIRALLPFKS